MVVVVHLDYSVSSGPFLRFSLRFEFLSEMFETRDPSLTIVKKTAFLSQKYEIQTKCTTTVPVPFGHPLLVDIIFQQFLL